jgi:hypothetical protein
MVINQLMAVKRLGIQLLPFDVSLSRWSYDSICSSACTAEVNEPNKNPQRLPRVLMSIISMSYVRLKS